MPTKRDLLPVHLPRPLLRQVLAARGMHAVNDRELVEQAEEALLTACRNGWRGRGGGGDATRQARTEWRS